MHLLGKLSMLVKLHQTAFCGSVLTNGLQVGGLKSTFVTAWMHGVIIYVVCCIFMFVGASCPNADSASKVTMTIQADSSFWRKDAPLSHATPTFTLKIRMHVECTCTSELCCLHFHADYLHTSMSWLLQSACTFQPLSQVVVQCTPTQTTSCSAALTW